MKRATLCGLAVAAAACSSSGETAVDVFDLTVNAAAAYETGVGYAPETGEFYTGSGDGLRVAVDDSRTVEIDAARGRAERELCDTYLDETTRSSAVLAVVIAQGEADERWTGGLRTDATDEEFAASEELSAELRSTENIEQIQRTLVDRCGIDVPDGFEFETPDDVFFQPGNDQCVVLERTYAVAIEAWYAQYGDGGGHPDGDDLVTDGFLARYDDSLVRVVEGSGTTRSSVTDGCGT